MEFVWDLHLTTYLGVGGWCLLLVKRRGLVIIIVPVVSFLNLVSSNRWIIVVGISLCLCRLRFIISTHSLPFYFWISGLSLVYVFFMLNQFSLSCS